MGLYIVRINLVKGFVIWVNVNDRVGLDYGFYFFLNIDVEIIIVVFLFSKNVYGFELNWFYCN